MPNDSFSSVAAYKLHWPSKVVRLLMSGKSVASMSADAARPLKFEGLHGEPREIQANMRKSVPPDYCDVRSSLKSAASQN